MSIYNLNPALESPPYGEALEAGELFLDGTDSLVSSAGNEPVVDVVDYVPSKISVDGSEVDNDISKWPGYRSTYGFFGEYENVSSTVTPTDANASITDEGDWMKVEAPANGASYRTWSGPASVTDGFVQVTIMRGNTDIVSVLWSIDFRVDFANRTFYSSGAAIDAGSYFVSENIAVMRFSPGVGAVSLRLYAGDGSGGTAGDYTYYKDWMNVDLPYAVPYVAGVHQPAKLQYNKDWAESAEWTIQGWAKQDAAQLGRIVFIGPNIDGYDKTIILSVDSNLDLNLYTRDDAGNYSETIGSPITAGQWFHCKIVLSPTSIELFQDGVSQGSHTTNIPALSDIAKTLFFGNQLDDSNPLRGYLQDWTIQPGIDTSTTHYTSGLPYYDPEKTYGQDGSWSIDKRGNFSGIPQQAGNIIEEFELDGQFVTKWDSGLMIISGKVSTTLACNIAAGTLFRTTQSDVNAAFSYPEEFRETPISSVDLVTGTTSMVCARLSSATYNSSSTLGFQLWRIATSASDTYSIRYISVGRWK